MPHVYVLPDQRLVECRAGETVLDAALRAAVPWVHACGGEAQCSTCRMVVIEGLDACGARTKAEEVIAGRLDFGPEFRLACQARATDDITVRRLVIDRRDQELADIRPRFARRERSAPAPLRRIFGGFVRRRTVRRPIGEEKAVAVLFSDIRGFTPFAEALLPYDVIHVLERHLRDMTEAVESHRGTVTAYMGDGVMALFGLEAPDTAVLDAVGAGLEMLARVDRLRPGTEQLYGRSFDVNVGIHYGDAIVGALWGDPSAITAMGDAVNVAARVEGANKEAGTRLLVTEPTFEAARNGVVVARSMCCALPGKAGEHTLYEVVGLRGGEPGHQ